MDTTKRSPIDRLLFATFLKGRTSSRDIWEEKGDMTPKITRRLSKKPTQPTPPPPHPPPNHKKKRPKKKKKKQKKKKKKNGWATVFTLVAWFAGLVIDVNVRVGDLGLRTVLPVIVMGCCVMKYIKGNSK